jgi:hypothetical protein
MNKSYSLLAVASVVMLAACSDYDPGMSESNVGNYTKSELKLMDKYSRSFESRYGTIDSGHTWGFISNSELTAQSAKTRGSYPNGNMWASDGYEAPLPITDAERAAVVEAFRTHTVSNTNPQLTNFFVQQVYKGGWQYALVNHTEDEYTYPDNTEGNPNHYMSSDHMDHLHCGVTTNEWDPYDHVFDFNYGTSNDYNGCMLMLNSATTDFYYHNSVDNIDHHEYIILTVNWTEPDGTARSGAYVGFDFYATGENPNQQCERDWKFDDWIVKIIPGEGEPDTPAPTWYRIMCEDLGNIYDYDFNDLVFDVYFTENQGTPQYTAHVRVQAAGGTLPIYLMYDQNEAYEAHHLMGFSETNIPVNVNNNRTAGWHDIEIPMDSDNPNDIDIYVTKTAAENTKETMLLPAAGVDVIVSKAPQKICIPNGTSVRWLRESQQIEWAYPHFSDWVKDEHGQYGFDALLRRNMLRTTTETSTTPTPWTTTDVNTSYLF